MREPKEIPLIECFDCGESFSEARSLLGYNLCLACGEKAARQARASWCIAPAGHKQGYTLHTDKSALRGLNKTAQ